MVGADWIDDGRLSSSFVSEERMLDRLWTRSVMRLDWSSNASSLRAVAEARCESDVSSNVLLAELCIDGRLPSAICELGSEAAV